MSSRPISEAEPPAGALEEPVVSASSSRADLRDVWLDRDIGWLEFNGRVLHEALDERTPLLERVKFLAIFSANLDEFFMKRIALLRPLAGDASARGRGAARGASPEASDDHLDARTSGGVLHGGHPPEARRARRSPGRLGAS